LNPNHPNQLRSYIAPGAPATRRPCDGTEAPLRIEFGFTPRWYRERLGIDFSERWHVDPHYRRGTVIAMKRELNRRFPGLGLGGDAPEDTPANLDGVHGALLIARAFGIPAEYYADNWPASTLAHLSEDQIARLEPPSLPDAPVFAQLLEQMETIGHDHGRIEGWLNWQGVLNNAQRIRGPEILTDLMINPDLAHRLFDVVTETMISGMKIVYERQKQSGVTVRHATVSNCFVNMVSPEVYREHLLPYDLRIAGAFELIGIHNCAWNVDPYIEDYATVPNLAYVDMGLSSDLNRVRELCPQARRALMYTPMDLANKPLEEIDADLQRIHRELGPCDVVMADIDHETPDERILAVAAMARKIGGA
jgi:hypothetical protein